MRTGARLTLDRYWSEDLETDYSTIYRTISEYEDMLAMTLGRVGLEIQLMGDLYPPSSSTSSRRGSGSCWSEPRTPV